LANNTLLITFGCSWTYGVGVNYESGMTNEEFQKNKEHINAEICDKFSWRGILCEKYNIQNINFSFPGSSNQRQFRYAREFFPSNQFKNLQKQYDRIIVLWGITSTARNEVYYADEKIVKDIFYHQDSAVSKFLLLNCYNHRYEVRLLRQHMIFWEHYFSLQNVENYWFDTLNTHNYKDINDKFDNNFPNLDWYHRAAGPDWPSYENFCQGNFTGISDEIMQEITSLYNNILPPNQILDHDKSPRDLMSWLSIESGIKKLDDSYHLSQWKIDGDRIEHLKLKKIVNPFSLHPTKDAHKDLANYFSERIKFN
jgi:hypothetical protein